MSTVSYLRRSSDQQDTLRQREDIQRSGLKIDEWLEDHESRDQAHKRPDFQRLLRAVQAGQSRPIVVQSLDRFGVKDAYEMGKFFSILRDHDCRLLDAAGKQLNAEDDATVLTSYHRRPNIEPGAAGKGYPRVDRQYDAGPQGTVSRRLLPLRLRCRGF